MAICPQQPSAAEQRLRCWEQPSEAPRRAARHLEGLAACPLHSFISPLSSSCLLLSMVQLHMLLLSPTPLLPLDAGRVKTLHPGVHGGILARRDSEAHVAALQQHDISTIDVVVVNLYPFRATVTAAQAPSFDTAVENIDIGERRAVHPSWAGLSSCHQRAAASGGRCVALGRLACGNGKWQTRAEHAEAHTGLCHRQQSPAAAPERKAFTHQDKRKLTLWLPPFRRRAGHDPGGGQKP